MRTRESHLRRDGRAGRQNHLRLAIVIALQFSLLTGNLCVVRAATPGAGRDERVAAPAAPSTPARPARADDPASTSHARAAAAEPAALQAPADAALLVVGSTPLTAGDNEIKVRLENLGFTVTVRDGPSVAAADTNGKRLVFISETTVAADVNTKLNGLAVPFVITEPGLFAYMGLTGTTNGTDLGNSAPATQVAITDPSHQMAAWLNGNVTVTSSAQPLAWGVPNANAYKVATVAGSPSQATLFGYEAGAAMVGGTAPARRVGLFLYRTVPEALNQNGWALFDAAVNWAARSALLVAGQPAPTASDLAVKSRMEGLGYKVRMRSGLDAATADAVGMAVVFISESSLSTEIGVKFRDVPVPVVVSEAALFDDMGMTGPTLGPDYNNLAGQTQLSIADAGHPLAAGRTGNVTVTTAGASFAWGRPAVGATRVATIAGDPTRVTVYGYERGAAMVSANAPARRVGFFLTRDTAAFLTADGWALFDAALDWAIRPQTALFVSGPGALSAADAAVKSRLEGLGYRVTVKTDTQVATADARGMSVIYASSTVQSANVNTKLRDVNVPVIVAEAALLDDMGMTGATIGTDLDNAVGQTQILIADPFHPMAAGFNGPVTVTTAAVPFAWGVPNANAAKVATLVANTNRSTVFGYERDAAMVSGTARTRRVGYYFFETVAANLNQSGWELFDAAVRWATFGDPVPTTPVLRPNGKIVFTSTRDGNPEVYVMNADGTGQTRLTNHAAADGDAAFSPDGSRIVFTSERDGNRELYLMNADGTDLRRLTDNPATDYDASWSPDGSQLAFESTRDGNHEIYVMYLDGFGLTNITNRPGGQDQDPEWSPDGRKFVFRGTHDGNDEIYTMNVDGSNPVRLTTNPTHDGEASWSTDGRKIIFMSQRDGNNELYTMNPDGTAQANITNHPALDDDPEWSPDGAKIIFTTARDGNFEIYTMNPDGTAPARLTTNAALDEEPNWSAAGGAGPTPTPTPSPSPTPAPTPLPTPPVGDTVEADVVAFDYAFFYNRYGAFNPAGMIYALRRDVVPIDSSQGLVPGNVRLRAGKRARPLVLRMNVGQKLRIKFQNLLGVQRADNNQPKTRTASVHVVGLQLVSSIADDGSNVGNVAPIGSLVTPGQSITYDYFAEREGQHLFYSTAATTGGEGNGGSLAMGLFGMVNVEPKGAEWYRSQVTRRDLELATVGRTAGDQPIINYDAVYPAGHARAGLPILRILHAGEIVHADLTAIITGPGRGNFPPGTYQSFPAQPNRDRPFREFSLVYHDEIKAVQAFPQFFEDPVLAHTLHSVRDAFAINYGTGGIGAEILANRLGVGPPGDCVECLYEEFFLSSWAVSDPAQIVDVPASTQVDADGEKIPGAPRATKVFFPEDPSNTYQSYLNDPVKMRVTHAGPKEHHIHHLHAHQWMHTPDSENSTLLDSQAFGPGYSFVTEILRGAGNRNRTPGDAIFHCHFYPHFAMGMWGLWRVHDVFEEGTKLGEDGRPRTDVANRALPDAEIMTGTPIPAVVPIPTLPMPPAPQAQVNIVNGQAVVTGAGHPGYPFFVPGVAGHRPPHPPLDTIDDGGLPRHVITSGEATHHKEHDPAFDPQKARLDFDKHLEVADARQLREEGTDTEVAAMNYHAQRTHPSFTPAGLPASFITNGLPPKPGAPFADPCTTDDGLATGIPRLYKSANIQLDVKFNKAGWHFPQQRISALWDDVTPFLLGQRPPEPLFFRANTNDCIQFQFTNLVPRVYVQDDFQVRTPTDIMGQHIHLVKFDVTSSDGAANGFNYEDGSFAPEEVQERILAINNGGGLRHHQTGNRFTLNAREHPFFGEGPDANLDGHPDWLGAQTTVSRWFADRVPNNNDEDRTLRTAFTHDHFGPSTHQQVGLYAGLVIEPQGSTWRHPETGQIFGGRFDGGPTSWRADILTLDPADSYREFMVEFADFQHAYKAGGGVDANNRPVPDPANAINPPGRKEVGLPFLLEPPQECPVNEEEGEFEGPVPVAPCPEAISADDVGTFVLNYRNEPVPLRIVNDPNVSHPTQAAGLAGDLSHVYRSDITRAFAPMNSQPNFYPPLTGGVFNGDPFTPIFRAYEDDRVQIRILVGAHEEGHNFGVHGVKWLFEPSDPNSGYRNNQMMGISEHFEFIIPTLPKSSIGSFADYLYQPGVAVDDQWNGLWGIMRAYNRTQTDLQPLPNNRDGHGPVISNVGDFNGVCPKTAPTKLFQVSAVLARDVMPTGSPQTLIYNPRTNRGGFLHDPTAILYVRDEDLDAGGKLASNMPEPLILRANAGDCVKVQLHNRLPEVAPDLPGFNTMPMIVNRFNANQVRPSSHVGLHPQLVFFDVTRSDGTNVGFNKVQTAAPGQSVTYQWYAGDMKVAPNGFGQSIPIEFGATNLSSSDPIKHSNKGAIGALVIEPQGATWTEVPHARSQTTINHAGGSFREFVLLHQTDVNLRYSALLDEQNQPRAVPNTAEAEDPEDSGQKAFNYRTEPLWKRMEFDPDTPLNGHPGDSRTPTRDFDFTNSLNNQQVGGDPVTPVFTAAAGQAVRFRLLMPGGHARNSVFNLHGHIWEELPWMNNSTRQGHNPLSNWHGTQFGIGPGSHFNVLLKNGAGGRFQVPGDYLYRNQTSFLFDGGMWGIFRVQ